MSNYSIRLLFSLTLLITPFNYTDSIENFALALIDISNDPAMILQQLKDLPLSSELGPQKYQQTQFLTSKIFEETITEFIAVAQEHQKKIPWGNNQYNKQKNNLFVQKIVLPADSELEVHADFHGDGQSLVTWLQSLVKDKWLDTHNPFKIIKDNGYIICLGDYADRGKYGAEIFFILYQLFIQNPDQVFLIRGNHEEKWVQQSLGFSTELESKFGTQEGDKILDILAQSYHYLPTALFVGCKNKNDTVDFILFAHACTDPYNTQPLLDDTAISLYERLATSDTTSGFTNCIFDLLNGSPSLNKPGYQAFTTSWFKKSAKANHLWSLFRGHQHGPEDVLTILKKGNGMYRSWCDNKENTQWNGDSNNPIFIGEHSVWTMNVAPFTGGYSDPTVKQKLVYDTVARITLQPDFANWVMQPRKL